MPGHLVEYCATRAQKQVQLEHINWRNAMTMAREARLADQRPRSGSTKV